MVRRTARQLFATIGLLALPFTVAETVADTARLDVPTYALVNARIVPVSARPIQSGTLLLRDGKIAAIGQSLLSKTVICHNVSGLLALIIES